MEREATKFRCKFALSYHMKRYLAIALCLLSCLFFREETVRASRHVPSSLYGSKLAHNTGPQGAEEMKAGNLSGQVAAKQENKPEVHQAARPAEPASQQSFMNTELFALLLLIMVLGMLYTNPTR